MTEENNTAPNLIWGVVTIIVVAMIIVFGYFVLEKFNRNTKHDVDIKITAPSR